jgi:hypothetical protein
MLAALCACAGPSATGDPVERGADAALRAELLEMREVDQRYRDVEYVMSLPRDEQQKYMREGAAADRRHAERLGEIVEQHGWPTRALVGEDGAHAAFLLAQHADHDPELQQRMLPLLEAASKEGEVDPADVAYLTDRVRVKLSRPQVYGTQYEVASDASGSAIVDEHGKPTYLLPLVVDPEQLDERRRAVGLGPWIEYERRMAELQEREPQPAPRSSGDAGSE